MISETNSILFRISHRNPRSIVPVVDGVSFIDLVADFERAAGYSPAGGYGGLVPSNWLCGPLGPYYRGAPKNDHLQELSSIYLLGCECGEVECWPLLAKAEALGAQYVWSEFQNGHRDWSYEGFGPFVFRKDQYEAAIDAIPR